MAQRRVVQPCSVGHGKAALDPLMDIVCTT